MGPSGVETRGTAARLRASASHADNGEGSGIFLSTQDLVVSSGRQYRHRKASSGRTSLSSAALIYNHMISGEAPTGADDGVDGPHFAEDAAVQDEDEDEYFDTVASLRSAAFHEGNSTMSSYENVVVTGGSVHATCISSSSRSSLLLHDSLLAGGRLTSIFHGASHESSAVSSRRDNRQSVESHNVQIQLSDFF